MRAPKAQPSTHEVFNQPPPLADYNAFDADPALREGVIREGAAHAMEDLSAFAATLGTAHCQQLGDLANRHPPELRSFDAQGFRRDEVLFHPAWQDLLSLSVAAGLHTSPWAHPGTGAHVARAAGFLLMAQVEIGHLCPISMTYSALAALRHQPDLAEFWRPKLYSREYDPRFMPAAGKRGVLMGMGMTEKQGGSDLRVNTTRAEAQGAGGPGREYRLSGHKWFLSAPMCDAFLMLAQTDRGPSCFLVPRWTPAGELNALRLQRLKDKVGNRSNASSEVELEQALGYLVGEEGRGIPILIEMATYTRLDCVLGSAGMMRRAATLALHHARHRQAFGAPLVRQPLMAALLADLLLESEAALVLALRLARAFDGARDAQPAGGGAAGPAAGDRTGGDAAESEAGSETAADPEAALKRLLTPAAKFWVCKRGIELAAEAMEVHGGNGYVEEHRLGRLYREMPVNSIWEGSGNIMCLDVLRALSRESGVAEALRHELAATRGSDPRLDRAVAAFEQALAEGRATEPAAARYWVERLMLCVQASLLIGAAPPAVAEAFLATRLGGEGGRLLGTWSGTVAVGPLLERLTLP